MGQSAFGSRWVQRVVPRLGTARPYLRKVSKRPKRDMTLRDRMLNPKFCQEASSFTSSVDYLFYFIYLA